MSKMKNLPFILIINLFSNSMFFDGFLYLVHDNSWKREWQKHKASHEKCWELTTSQEFVEHKKGLHVGSFLLLVLPSKQAPKEHFQKFPLTWDFWASQPLSCSRELHHTATLAEDAAGHHLILKILSGIRVWTCAPEPRYLTPQHGFHS